jgi:hypothetical protein
MTRTQQLIPVAGLFATIGLAAYMVVQLNGQAIATTGDFSNAAVAEVRDARGQVVLRGQFAIAADEEPEDEVERKATLMATGADADASGEAEIEFATATPAAQELEFSVENLAPNTTVTFVIDGTDVATATTDGRGRAEAEWDVN